MVILATQLQQACTVTLPATASAGDQVQLVDYAGTLDTNALVINPNGLNIEGGTDNRLQLSGRKSRCNIVTSWMLHKVGLRHQE
jgi:hypothetical protein